MSRERNHQPTTLELSRFFNDLPILKLTQHHQSQERGELRRGIMAVTRNIEEGKRKLTAEKRAAEKKREEDKKREEEKKKRDGLTSGGAGGVNGLGSKGENGSTAAAGGEGAGDCGERKNQGVSTKGVLGGWRGGWRMIGFLVFLKMDCSIYAAGATAVMSVAGEEGGLEVQLGQEFRRRLGYGDANGSVNVFSDVTTAAGTSHPGSRE